MAVGDDRRLAARIRQAFEARDAAAQDGKGLDAFLAEQLGVDDARTILDTLHGIAANHREILASEDGRRVWLARVIESAREHLAEGAEIAIADVGSSATAVSGTLARELEEGLARSLGAGLQGDAECGGAIEPIEAARAYFERELGHPDDIDTIATLTSAVLPSAREHAPGQSAQGVAAAVDLGASAAKAAYQVGAERIDQHEAVSWLLDRAAAAAGEAIRRATPELAARGGEWLGAMLGALVGNAPAGATVGREFGRLAGTAVAEPLARGVERFVRSIPGLASNAYNAMREWVRPRVEWLFG